MKSVLLVFALWVGVTQLRKDIPICPVHPPPTHTLAQISESTGGLLVNKSVWLGILIFLVRQSKDKIYVFEYWNGC